MRKMTELSILEANGGANQRAICWTCYAERDHIYVWAANAKGLTRSTARKNARKKLDMHTDGKEGGHSFSYLAL